MPQNWQLPTLQLATGSTQTFSNPDKGYADLKYSNPLCIFTFKQHMNNLSSKKCCSSNWTLNLNFKFDSFCSMIEQNRTEIHTPQIFRGTFIWKSRPTVPCFQKSPIFLHTHNVSFRTEWHLMLPVPEVNIKPDFLTPLTTTHRRKWCQLNSVSPMQFQLLLEGAFFFFLDHSLSGLLHLFCYKPKHNFLEVRTEERNSTGQNHFSLSISSAPTVCDWQTSVL